MTNCTQNHETAWSITWWLHIQIFSSHLVKAPLTPEWQKAVMRKSINRKRDNPAGIWESCELCFCLYYSAQSKLHEHTLSDFLVSLSHVIINATRETSWLLIFDTLTQSKSYRLFRNVAIISVRCMLYRSSFLLYHAKYKINSCKMNLGESSWQFLLFN